MLLKDADLLVKFVTAIVSVSSVLFLSASFRWATWRSTWAGCKPPHLTIC